jgi:hypothetical protein
MHDSYQTISNALKIAAEWYQKAPISEVEAVEDAIQEIFPLAEIQAAMAAMDVLVQRDRDLCNIFEDFLKTMDDIMGGGSTVVRFRDRYEKLTGKKIRIMGDPMNEEV